MAGRFRGFGGPRANRRTREEGGCASSLEVAPMRQRKSGVTDAITSLQNYPKWVAPICSMRAWLTAKPDGVGGPSSGPRSRAGPTSHGCDGRMVSAVRGKRAWPARTVWLECARLRLSNFGYGGHDLPGHPNSIAGLVSRDMVGDDAEERCQRVGAATSARPEEI